MKDGTEVLLALLLVVAKLSVSLADTLRGILAELRKQDTEG